MTDPHKRVIDIEAALECLRREGISIDPAQVSGDPLATVRLRKNDYDGSYAISVWAQLRVRKEPVFERPR